MKKFLIFIIFASLQVKGGIFNLRQNKAILGEPVILEIKDLRQYPLWAQNYLFIEGPEIECIELEKYQDRRRINLVDYFKSYGDYEIKIIPDSTICNLSKELKKQKEELERIEDEKEYEIMKMKIEEDEKKIEYLKKQEHLYTIISSFKIEIDYPQDFDKQIYENYLKNKESLSSFWDKGYFNENLEDFKNLIDEILKHPESSFYPWAMYLVLRKSLIYSRSLKEEYNKISLNEKGIAKKYDNKEKVKFLEEMIKGIEKIEKDFKEFPFLDELVFQKGMLSFLLGINDEELNKIFNQAKDMTEEKELKEMAEKFLTMLNGEKR